MSIAAPTTSKVAASARTSHVARAPRAYAPRPCSTARSASPLCTSRSAASMSGDICRSPSHGRTCLRTSACRFSSGLVVLSGRWNSRPWHAASSSIASTVSTFCTTSSALRAAKPPMLTWSSLAAEVEMVSTEEGWQSTLFSEASAAAVQCAIMKPELKPPSATRKAGRPESDGLHSRSMRRSAMFAISVTAIARKSSTLAGYSPWKLPPEMMSPPPSIERRVSVSFLKKDQPGPPARFSCRSCSSCRSSAAILRLAASSGSTGLAPAFALAGGGDASAALMSWPSPLRPFPPGASLQAIRSPSDVRRDSEASTCSCVKTIGLSVAELSSVLRMRRTNSMVSCVMPCTCGTHRSEYASWTCLGCDMQSSDGAVGISTDRTRAADSICPECGRTQWMSGSNARLVPQSTSSERAAM
mmetsp:Transcript_33628/g.111231  ORF Transcript_33628/g.111231 Transcript_33628/m.111231 type:complete len:415 (+) Transcript_33628:199-1443(+)